MAFWAVDILKGNIIKDELEDINDSMNISDFELLQKKNENILKSLLNTATSYSNFYKQYKGCDHLNDFPVVNKSIIKENINGINIISNLKEKKISVTTSGSTGTPLTIFQSKRKKARNTADTIYFANSSGFTLGDQLLYLRSWTAYYRKKSLIAKIQNIKQIDVSDLNDEYLKKTIADLENNKYPKGWLGYPSAFEDICDYLYKTNSEPLKCNVKSIIAMSESLGENVKTSMEYYFNAPTVSRYSNVENGIIAQQMPKKDFFTINWASYIVEILNINEDVPVALGELGRIVITDLYNFATPMIRYDTGDIGSFIINKKNNFPMFKTVHGRKSDILKNTKGENINPFVFFNNLYRYPELKQVQFIQKTNKDFIFRINCKVKFHREAEFVSFFKKHLGNDAEIKVKYVDKIPKLKSGKRKLLVNETENHKHKILQKV